jgi:type III secretion protein V
VKFVDTIRSRAFLRTTMLEQLAYRGDIAVVLLILTIIALFVLPLPTELLDFLIAVNIASSVGLLMMAIYVPTSVGLSTFPSLLLLTTLLRLSLNIASTKQILLNAHAGEIIETFGRLVVGGNALIGGVVFTIIAIVQFIVVAKGGERVAEVGARFTLDGMPGKQMSIDADLRAGLINKEEARARRHALEQDSQWHGAMDGAMKFVKGDAIAGLVIAFVNIIAGIGVGVGMKGMAFSEAVQRYTLLTVGEGMVSQIPSLFVSVAAAALITRVSSVDDRRTNLGRQIMRQILAQPLALCMTAIVLFAFVAVPGFPKIQFVVLGLIVSGMSWAAWKRDEAIDDPEHQPLVELQGDGERIAPSMIQQGAEREASPLQIRLSPSLKGKLVPEALGRAVQSQKNQIYELIGLPFPGIRIKYDPLLAVNQYCIFARDIKVGEGVLLPGHLWVEFGGSTPNGMLTKDLPGLGTGAWVDEANIKNIESNKTFVGLEKVLSAHIKTSIVSKPDYFVGVQEVQKIIDDIAKNQPDLAQEVLRTVPLQRIAEVMRLLVRSGISLRNTRELFESLIVWVPKEKDLYLLTEYVRIDLGAITVARLSVGRSELPIIMLNQESEQLMRDSIQETMAGTFVSLGAEKSESLVSQATQLYRDAVEKGIRPVFTCSLDLRRHLASQLEPVFPDVPVVSYQEVASHIRVSLAGSIDLVGVAALEADQ